uniref:Putative secreted protein n=1 Tax=Ixodes ricinus TaxID=34613 RepID=A0A6B0V3A6_IXORI
MFSTTGCLGGSGLSLIWTLMMAESVPSSFSATRRYGPLSVLLTSRMVSTAWRSPVWMSKWLPLSISSPSLNHLMRGFGKPVNGILRTTFSPFSKQASSRKRGGTLMCGAVLMRSSALDVRAPPLLTARQAYSSASSPKMSEMMSVHTSPSRVMLYLRLSCSSRIPLYQLISGEGLPTTLQENWALLFSMPIAGLRGVMNSGGVAALGSLILT